MHLFWNAIGELRDAQVAEGVVIAAQSSCPHRAQVNAASLQGDLISCAIGRFDAQHHLASHFAPKSSRRALEPKLHDRCAINSEDRRAGHELGI